MIPRRSAGVAFILVVLVLDVLGIGVIIPVLPLSLGGLAGPAINALLTREVTPAEQGELQGSLGSLQSIAAMIGPLVATGLFSRFASDNAVPHVPGAPFFLAALLNFAAFVLAWRLFTRLRPAPA